jgi:very-short-patch-repair endonuclease
MSMNKSNNLESMHYGADAFSFRNAERLRNRMTEAEITLWNELKNNRFMGLKFRRQHPIDRFVVDFYCHKHQLVIEVDGGIHLSKEVKENDINRELELKNRGLNIVRFTNEEVLNTLSQVLAKIENCISSDY